jgi:predicted nucleic acid-binding protein
MRAIEVYVETSVWNAPFSRTDPTFKRIGRTFFDHASRFQLFISTIVTAEVLNYPEPKRGKLVNLIAEQRPTEIEITDEVEILAEKYIEHDAVPSRYLPDALHIAAASIQGVDYIVSLNFAHIVREKTRNIVAGVNAITGYITPKIMTPGEI